MFENKFLHRIDRIYAIFLAIGNNLQSLFLFYMRFIWGHQFFLTGIAKFNHIDIVTQFFANLHIPYPLFNAYLVASIETVCGFCLFVGFASRIITIPLIMIMTTAFSLAHREVFTELRFLFEPSLLVCEAPYPFLLASLMVFIFGPGRISIDAWIKRWAHHRPKY